MSEVNQIICDICGKPMFEKSLETGYHLRGATGRAMSLKSFFGLTTDDEVDVCDECWGRMRREARKEADNG